MSLASVAVNQIQYSLAHSDFSMLGHWDRQQHCSTQTGVPSMRDLPPLGPLLSSSVFSSGKFDMSAIVNSTPSGTACSTYRRKLLWAVLRLAWLDDVAVGMCFLTLRQSVPNSRVFALLVAVWMLPHDYDKLLFLPSPCLHLTVHRNWKCRNGAPAVGKSAVSVDCRAIKFNLRRLDSGLTFLTVQRDSQQSHWASMDFARQDILERVYLFCRAKQSGVQRCLAQRPADAQDFDSATGPSCHGDSLARVSNASKAGFWWASRVGGQNALRHCHANKNLLCRARNAPNSGRAIACLSALRARCADAEDGGVMTVVP